MFYILVDIASSRLKSTINNTVPPISKSYIPVDKIVLMNEITIHWFQLQAVFVIFYSIYDITHHTDRKSSFCFDHCWSIKYFYNTYTRLECQFKMLQDSITILHFRITSSSNLQTLVKVDLGFFILLADLHPTQIMYAYMYEIKLVCLNLLGN